MTNGYKIFGEAWLRVYGTKLPYAHPTWCADNTPVDLELFQSAPSFSSNNSLFLIMPNAPNYPAIKPYILPSSYTYDCAFLCEQVP
jgi:hypothetical protein